MPPKRTYNNESDDDDDSSSTASSSGDDTPVVKKAPVASSSAAAQQGRGVVNRPHDEEYDVGYEEDRKTPPENGLRKPVAAATTATITPAAKNTGNILRNNPNDETFDVEDDDRAQTPPRGGNAAAVPQAQRKPSQTGGASAAMLRNNPHDEYEDVNDDVDTPPRQQQQLNVNKKPGGLSSQALQAPGGRQISNDHHDEAIDVSDHSHGSPSSTHGSSTPQSVQKVHGKPSALPQGKMSMMQPASDSSSEDDEESAAARQQATTKAKAVPTLEYNPADYASINQRASREMQEIFTYIAAYQPLVQELPSKLRPFIPDYIPSVGDLDPFCKIPRPDGRPDNFGLHVVDEPCANQSNPAVVKIGLQYTVRGHIPSVFVDCVENAANLPHVVDKWVADIKQLHYKKPLPSVNYSKPMPEIESLLQVWPPEFEELLNSDLQFPPTQVDLDIHQYVRVMCAILDIPTYGSLIESLHVMFTLYCEFRANQHFQHA